MWLNLDVLKAILFSFMIAPLALSASGPNPYLSQAKVYYQDLEFERCLKRLSQALKWENSIREDAEMALYNGLCELGLGKDKVARKEFEMALRLEPNIALPAQQSPKIQAIFLAAQQSVLTDNPSPAPVETPKQTVKEVGKDVPVVTPLTPKEPAPGPIEIVQETAAPSRAVPIAFAVAGGVAVATGLILGILAQSKAAEANSAVFESDAIQYGNSAQGLATGANVAYVSGGALGIGAVISYFVTASSTEPASK